MSVYFSELMQAFYATDVDYPELPKDLILLTDKEHNLLWNRLNTGYSVSIASDGFSFTPKIVTLSWNDIRARREGELARTDYTQMADWPGDKEVWALYRQELRDIPQNFSDPNEVVWPTPPEQYNASNKCMERVFVDSIKRLAKAQSMERISVGSSKA